MKTATKTARKYVTGRGLTLAGKYRSSQVTDSVVGLLLLALAGWLVTVIVTASPLTPRPLTTLAWFWVARSVLVAGGLAWGVVKRYRLRHSPLYYLAAIKHDLGGDA